MPGLLWGLANVHVSLAWWADSCSSRWFSDSFCRPFFLRVVGCEVCQTSTSRCKRACANLQYNFNVVWSSSQEGMSLLYYRCVCVWWSLFFSPISSLCLPTSSHQCKQSCCRLVCIGYVQFTQTVRKLDIFCMKTVSAIRLSLF